MRLLLLFLSALVITQLIRYEYIFSPSIFSYEWDDSIKGLILVNSSKKPVTISGSDNKTIAKDLNNNGVDETYKLNNGKMTVSENYYNIWKSPEDWYIDEFLISDINNDGTEDINLFLWKPGSFGEFLPFWMKENDNSVKNHLFIYDLEEKKLIPVWHSSNLDSKNLEMKIFDIDNDSMNELLVIEQDYDEVERCKNNRLAIYKWNEWGFYNVWKSDRGNYCNLR